MRCWKMMQAPDAQSFSGLHFNHDHSTSSPMNHRPDTTDLIETFFEKASDYGRTSITLFKLRTADRIADAGSSLAADVIVSLFGLVFVFMVNVGAAFWIGESLGRIYVGFFIVSAFYALAGSLVFFFRRQWLKAPIGNSILKKILD
jgi:hypothetical protein